MRVLITGGAGFIGSALVRHLIGETDWSVVNVDKLTYAASLDRVAAVADDDRYRFVQSDICNTDAMLDLLSEHRPDAVVHLAAESHVDRSIDDSSPFIRNNVLGTYILLEVTRAHLRRLSPDEAEGFRFLHVSTDEVFGSHRAYGAFTEESRYAPASPYAASKAAADHLVRAWHQTYGLPVMLSNCSNNYGPYQYPEKLIPVVVRSAAAGKPIPIYGEGKNVRDWIHVDDHARALVAIVREGRVGQTYNVGARCELSNLDLVTRICGILDELRPDSPHRPHANLITFVEDRPGHDRRYAINPTKIERDLGWKPEADLETALRATVAWYLENEAWGDRVTDGAEPNERRGLASQPRS